MSIRSESPTRYAISTNGSLYRILDTWHPAVADLPEDMDAEISETSPALTVLTDGQVQAIIQFLKIPLEDQKTDPRIIEVPVEKIVEKIIEVPQARSEHYQLKKDAIDAMVKLAGIQEINK